LDEFCKSARRFRRNSGNQYDRSILNFFNQICHDPRFLGFEKAIPIIAALQCTSVASERAFYLSNCGSASNSFERILSKVSKSIQTGNETKKYVMDLISDKIKKDMLKSIHPTAGPNLYYWMIVGYDNYQKNKTVHLSSKACVDPSFIQLIVGL